MRGKKLATGGALLWLFASIGYGRFELPAENPTWGLELTLTSQAQLLSDHGASGEYSFSRENLAALDKVYRTYREKLSHRIDVESVRYFEAGDKWNNDFVRVKYRNGFHFDVTMDPYCLEFILPPMTLPELEKQETRIQRDIYDTLGVEGFYPHRKVGGGHVHLGARSGFGDDVMLFRNWLVDTVNHRELGSGALEQDYDNARPFFQFSLEQKRALQRLVWHVDAGVVKTPRELATRFVAEVLFEGKPATGPRITANRYWQVNILRMADLDTEGLLSPNERWADYQAWILYDEVAAKTQTAEVRHIRTQQSARDVVLDVRLQQARLRYLQTKYRDNPLPLAEGFLHGQGFHADEAAERFARYIQESGLNPRDYLTRIPKEGDGIRDVARWRASFLRAARACTTALAALGKVSVSLHR